MRGGRQWSRVIAHVGSVRVATVVVVAANPTVVDEQKIESRQSA